jgi:hypothetical protein
MQRVFSNNINLNNSLSIVEIQKGEIISFAIFLSMVAEAHVTEGILYYPDSEGRSAFCHDPW